MVLCHKQMVVGSGNFTSSVILEYNNMKVWTFLGVVEFVGGWEKVFVCNISELDKISIRFLQFPPI